MPDFIFSIQGIFTECLSQNKAESYYIGPYQRGYKWKSKSIYDHIPVLLTDLFEAFLKSQKSQSKQEYFLQYITVKRTLINGTYCFEVIDGQQRLTTLTLLCNVLEKYYDVKNVSKWGNNNLLSYARYENKEKSIFDTILELLSSEDVNEEEIEEQDVYFMYCASKCIYTFFETLKEETPEEFNEFVEYLIGNNSGGGKVKIILNKEDEFTAAEEVFSSLNANKVPLTNGYLIKGLLLTKASRSISETQQHKHFKEIMDERSIMGRTWDEMNSWFSQPEVACFYFGKEENGLEKMLELIEFKNNASDSMVISRFREKLEDAYQSEESKYQLFNYYHEHILSPEDSLECLNTVKHIYKRLKSWYEGGLYNYLGYLLTALNSSEQAIEVKGLLKLDNDELLKKLKLNILKKLPESGEDIKNWSYDKTKRIKIEDLLLALSVFPEGVSKSYRFDFYKKRNEEWTFEHIFPQNPNIVNFKIADDKDWVLSKVNDMIDRLKLQENIQQIAELELVRDSILKNEDVETNSISFVFEAIEDVHSMGNMALLSKKVNSSLSNGLFNTKRKILLTKINGGSFVPKHTIDVFSKMIESPSYSNDSESKSFDPTLTNWTNKDIDLHLDWMKQRIEVIKKEFGS